MSQLNSTKQQKNDKKVQYSKYSRFMFCTLTVNISTQFTLKYSVGIGLIPLGGGRGLENRCVSIFFFSELLI